MQSLPIPTQQYELPLAYQLALTHLSQHTGKPPISILIEAFDAHLNELNSASKLTMNPIEPTKREATLLRCSSQIDVIPIGNKFGLLVKEASGYFKENKQYPNLALALSQAKEYERNGHTILDNWIPISGDYPPLILHKVGGLAHLWFGQNTACNLTNNKVVKLEDYTISKDYPAVEICKCCLNNYTRTFAPKFQVAFDSNNHIQFPNLQSFDPLF